MSASEGPRLSVPVSAADALERLRHGNRRFVQGVRSVDSLLSQTARRALVGAQVPFAVVLSCSDSRAPAELVFDQGLGDLFVVRVAGNIAAVPLVGSVEFAVAAYRSALIVVMGHSRCGVIASMVDGAAAERAVSPNVLAIFDHARPAIDEVLRSSRAAPTKDRDALLAAATRANVRWSAARLREGSELIATRVQQGTVLVVGAEYSLETGAVDYGAQRIRTQIVLPVEQSPSNPVITVEPPFLGGPGRGRGKHDTIGRGRPSDVVAAARAGRDKSGRGLGTSAEGEPYAGNLRVT